MTERDGCYYMDLAGLVAEIEVGTTWADLGLPELYGTVAVNTTDRCAPTRGICSRGSWPTCCAAR